MSRNRCGKFWVELEFHNRKVSGHGVTWEMKTGSFHFGSGSVCSYDEHSDFVDLRLGRRSTLKSSVVYFVMTIRMSFAPKFRQEGTPNGFG